MSAKNLTMDRNIIPGYKEFEKDALKLAAKCGEDTNKFIDTVAESIVPTIDISSIFLLYGIALSHSPYLKTSFACLERALMSIRGKTKEDIERQTLCYMHLGKVGYKVRNFEMAVVCGKKAINCFKGLKDNEGECACYIDLGASYDSLGDYEEAIECYKKALKISMEIGDKAMNIMCCVNIGISYIFLNEFEKAIEYCEKGLKLAQEIGDKKGEIMSYMHLGVAYDKGSHDYVKSAMYSERALNIALEIGDEENISAGYGNLGVIYQNSGDLKKSIEYFLNAEQFFKKRGYEFQLKRVYKNMAETYGKMKNPEMADEYKRKAEEI